MESLIESPCEGLESALGGFGAPPLFMPIEVWASVSWVGAV